MHWFSMIGLRSVCYFTGISYSFLSCESSFKMCGYLKSLEHHVESLVFNTVAQIRNIKPEILFCVWFSLQDSKYCMFGI